jgi:hypothetical protein
MLYFPAMLKLEYLNLDQTEVTGKAFVEACREFHRRNQSYPQLKYLSIEQEVSKVKSSSDPPYNFSA